MWDPVCSRSHCPTTATKSSTWTAWGGTRCISTWRRRTPRHFLFPVMILILFGTRTRSDTQSSLCSLQADGGVVLSRSTHRNTRTTFRPTSASSWSTTTRWTTGLRAPSWTRLTRRHGSCGCRSSLFPSLGPAPCSGGSRPRANCSPSARISREVCSPSGRLMWLWPASR